MIRYLFSFSLVLLVPEANQREQFRFQSTIQKLELLSIVFDQNFVQKIC